MRIHLAKRFYYMNEDSLKTFEAMIGKLPAFNEANSSTGEHIELSFNVSANEEKLNIEQRERARVTQEKMTALGFAVHYDGASATAGTKLIRQIFETQPARGVSDPLLGIACFDQFPLERPEHLTAINELALKVVNDQTLYATGSRNVPVVLGVNTIPSDMRVVHELVQLLASGSDKFKTAKPEWANPSTYYDYFGEYTSGLFLVNPTHSRYGSLKEKVHAQKSLFEKPGFAIEYTLALHAGLINAVSSGYIYAEKNPFYANVPEDEEKTRMSKFIVGQTGVVGKTWVRPALEGILGDANGVVDTRRLSTLYDFFDRVVVDEAVDLMRQGLHTS